MPYTAPISRANPTAILFLLDQSSSMLKPFGAQPGKSKAEGVGDALNRLLQNLVLKCTRADGVRNFFSIAMLSYGGQVASALGGALAGQSFVPISDIAHHPLRVEVRTRKVSDDAGGLVDEEFKFPVWFEARPSGRTPMCQALRWAKQGLEVFLRVRPNCYPPIVINITDGQPTDGDPREPADELRALASPDGNVLLFNAHLSAKQGRPIEFPDDEAGLPDDFARLLFRMSSELPPKLLEAAKGRSAVRRAVIGGAGFLCLLGVGALILLASGYNPGATNRVGEGNATPTNLVAGGNLTTATLGQTRPGTVVRGDPTPKQAPKPDGRPCGGCERGAPFDGPYDISRQCRICWLYHNDPEYLTFLVLGDGKVLWKSDLVDTARSVQDCKVDVGGIDVLELRVDCPGSGVNAHAVWLDPRVLLK